ncbi:FirrV-1-B56 [Feldmannia irregularis virus a]|uniref:FirrV-1-B56 n=1 Tax=Feldmannia irregularis virus a TaxID=231992 RepID=Q6XLY0_9PHYC|nr:FirrV-1-B56 [Feldmannia irregularis virus a]AAR26931.1 FirrV-1-B56 [Feldmannia irregularis virus a]
MDFDLVSAYSVRVFWKSDYHPSVVYCYPDNHPDQVIAAQCVEHEAAIVIVNLHADTTYHVSLESTAPESQRLTGHFVTCPKDQPCLANLYASIRRPDGVYDTTSFEKELHDVFLQHFSTIVSPGDRIFAKVEVNGVSQNVMAIAATEGVELEIDAAPDTNVFLPFFPGDNSEAVQTVTLKNKNHESLETLVYDAHTDKLAYGGDAYSVGDKFQMFNKTVTVADGSIVLLFSDTVAKTWPFDASKALAVVGSAGSHFMKNITCNVQNLVGQKTTGESGSTYSSAWVTNADDSNTLEVSRMVHELDDTSTTGTLSLGVLYTDSSNQQFIEPALALQATSTTISAQNDAEQTTSATFESKGLSFDTDDAAIYFGSSQRFRIKFSDGTPSALQIQSFDDTTSSYITRQEVTDSS